MAGEARNSNLIRDAICFDMSVRKLLKSDRDIKMKSEGRKLGSRNVALRISSSEREPKYGQDLRCQKCTIRDLSR